MKLLAQLPTPTIATRTLPSSECVPLLDAPLVSGAPFVVLIGTRSFRKRVAARGYAAKTDWLHPHARIGARGHISWLRSSPLTCHTRWQTVKVVSAAIT